MSLRLAVSVCSVLGTYVQIANMPVMCCFFVRGLQDTIDFKQIQGSHLLQSTALASCRQDI
jgi:hypothetical protein